MRAVPGPRRIGARAGVRPVRTGVVHLLGAALLLPLWGCMVHQPRGEGKLEHRVEPTTRRGYWLYLPKDYVQADETARAVRRWPLVVTFHGMKPYDIALYQAQEWEQEADRYGFIVAAPELRSFDFFTGEFPLRTLSRTFKSDELATLAIMDHVFETTHADPTRVLATSWSSGGYMAHYMLNRHPHRFTCLAARQSNFSATVLDPASTARSVRHPVLILSSELDIPVCKQETRDAIRWYESHGYKKLAWVYLSRLGHERTPDMAADFFARISGVQPKWPPRVLFQRQALDGNASGLALLAGSLPRSDEIAEGEVETATEATPRPGLPTPRRPVGQPAAADSGTRTARAQTPPAGPVTPKRRGVSDSSSAAAVPIAISVSSTIGFAPLLLVFGAECPTEWYRSADFAWRLNGTLIGQGVNGQTTITEPGDYTLELCVTADRREPQCVRRTIRVLRGTETAAQRP